MKGVVITKPGVAVLRDIKKPKPKDDEVLIRVKSAGLCGSDMHIFQGRHLFRIPPVMPGHELAGEIAAAGKEVGRFREGDRVTVLPSINCGICPACVSGNTNLCGSAAVPGTNDWSGAFVQYITAPERIVYAIKPKTPYENAVLAEPLAVAVHIVRRLNKGKRMIILGCGTIGLLVLKVALHNGFEEVYCTDICDFNLKTAIKMGAAAAWNAEIEDVAANTDRVTGSSGMDSVIITASAELLNMGLTLAADRGDVVMVAMTTKPVPIDLSLPYRKELRFTGTKIYTAEDFTEALGYIEGGVDFSPVVTHLLPMSEAQRAFDISLNKTEDVIKILLDPEK